MTRRLALLLSTPLLACQPNAESKPDDAAKAASPASEPAPASDEPAANTPTPAPSDPATEAPKPKREQAQDLHRKLMTLLNEGRALTKQGDYVGGIAKYREALDIDASDPSVLGELGWAAFKSGDLELAHKATLNGLKFVRDDQKRGMLLYNLGRIAEDRKQTDDAITHYRDSLTARPGNATVQSRLDALLAAGSATPPDVAAPPEPEPVYTPLPVIARDLPDLAAVCKQLTADRCDDFGMGQGDPCQCNDTLAHTPGADASWGLLTFGSSEFPSQIAWFPVVQTDKGWTVFEHVLYEYNPGAFGIYEEVKVDAVTVEPLLAKGTQLLMRMHKDRSDRDMGLNEIEDEHHAVVVVCARHDGGAACTRPLYEAYRYRREVEFEDFDDESIEHDPALPINSGFRATLSLGEKLVVAWVETSGGYDKRGEAWESHGWVLGAGEYELATLLGLPGAGEQ